jgi:hypothetical protein
VARAIALLDLIHELFSYFVLLSLRPINDLFNLQQLMIMAMQNYILILSMKNYMLNPNTHIACTIVNYVLLLIFHATLEVVKLQRGLSM